MDLITDLPPSRAHDEKVYDSIISFTDMLTKQAIFVRATKTISSTSLAHVFLEHVFSKKGLPNVIVSDRDPRLTSTFWSTLFKALGSHLNISTAYHPETDGQSEISHRHIEQILRAYVSPLHDDWATWLPVAEFSFNNAVHSSTHVSPFYANLGFHPKTPADFVLPTLDPDATDYLETLRDIQAVISRELEYSKAQQATQADRHRRPLEFQVGDRVRLSTDHLNLADYPSSKLKPRFLGPFEVSKVISPVAYKLLLPAAFSRLHPVFHVSKLLPWHSSSDADFPDRELPAQPLRRVSDYVRGDDVFEVDEIFDVKIATDPSSRARPKAPCLFFKVKWAPPYASSEHDSWEPLRNLAKLEVLKIFLSSSLWQVFAASDAYKAFALKFKSKVPKIFTFAE
jgi:hypothetical protein